MDIVNGEFLTPESRKEWRRLLYFFIKRSDECWKSGDCANGQRADLKIESMLEDYKEYYGKAFDIKNFIKTWK